MCIVKVINVYIKLSACSYCSMYFFSVSVFHVFLLCVCVCVCVYVCVCVCDRGMEGERQGERVSVWIAQFIATKNHILGFKLKICEAKQLTITPYLTYVWGNPILNLVGA